MGTYNGKIVLVTGAGRGAGKAIAEAFAAQGAKVVLNDISPVNVDEIVAQITASGGQARAYVEDVAKKVSVQAMINNLTDDWKRLDILVNCANVEPHTPLLDLDEWDWHRTLDVNLTGAFLLTQSVGRMMREQKGGVIVNVIPVAGRAEMPDRGAYVASKFGLAGLTRQAALELEPYNIHVHAVCTGLPELATTEESHDDVAAAVLALCADDTTGQIINIS
jgi:NAD(P)-dependent dehydrogenase (short-subunit alcohol dehydrogenase family)